MGHGLLPGETLETAWAVAACWAQLSVSVVLGFRDMIGGASCAGSRPAVEGRKHRLMREVDV